MNGLTMNVSTVAVLSLRLSLRVDTMTIAIADCFNKNERFGVT